MSAVLRLGLGPIVVLILLIVAGSRANAGVYSVAACDAAPASATHAWRSHRTAPEQQLEFVSQCPAGAPDAYGALRNGIGVIDVMKVYGAPPDGAYTEWRFVAPTGTAITAASITRDIGNRDEWTPYGRIDGVDQPGESCTPGMGEAFCRIQGTRVFSGLNAATIAYGVRCVTTPYCAHLWDLRSVWVLVLGATVTLDDRQAPTVSAVEASGVADGRWWNRAGVVSFSADDNTGIRRRRVLVDGVQRVVVDAPGVAAGGCGELGRGVAYTYARPCADSRGLNGLSSLPVDTCSWGDGVHSVRGGVTDTGGLEALTSAVPVRVDCSAPDVDVALPAGEVLAGEVVEPLVTASDAVSGVRETRVEVSVDGGPWSTHAAEVVAEAGRSYRFRARAVDLAGNASVWVLSGAVLGVAPAAPAPEPEPEPPSDQPSDQPTGGGGGGSPTGGGGQPSGDEAPMDPVVLPVVLAAPLPDAVPVLAGPPAQDAPVAPAVQVAGADPRLRISRVVSGRRSVTIAGTAAPALTTRAVVRIAAARGTRERRVAVGDGRWRARFARLRGIRSIAVATEPAAGFAAGRASWSRKRLHPLR